MSGKLVNYINRLLLITLLSLCLVQLMSCASKPLTEEDPTAFTANFMQVVNSGDEKALAAYKGNSYHLNVSADDIVSDEYINVRCTDNASIRVCIPQEELTAVHRGDVISLEGTVKEVEVKKYGDMVFSEMIIDPAHIIEDTFEVAGEVEEIFHDWDRDGQEYAAIWDSSVMPDHQINIFLSDDHHVQVGDQITARGKLLAPSNPEQFGTAYIRGRGTPDVFVMQEPDSVQKE